VTKGQRHEKTKQKGAGDRNIGILECWDNGLGGWDSSYENGMQQAPACRTKPNIGKIEHLGKMGPRGPGTARSPESATVCRLHYRIWRMGNYHLTHGGRNDMQ
jgi:hypothetical protein